MSVELYTLAGASMLSTDGVGKTDKMSAQKLVNNSGTVAPEHRTESSSQPL